MVKHAFHTLIGLLMAGGVLCSANLMAGEPKAWFDFGYIKKSDAWLTSENAAGLSNLKVDKVSFAEVYLNKSDGRFINYYQSNNSYSFGALTESFFRINNKVVFYGKMDYSKFTGKNMGGSSSLNPSYNPFDMVEFADSTAGKKEMESYHLTGALSANTLHNLLMGLKIDYKTLSYFKTKDLRHTNDLLDMTISAGFRYRFGKSVDAGINYSYRRTSEGISFSMAGNTDQQFNSLINFGAFIGRQERFGESGYTTSEDNKPFFNEFHGVSLQLDLFPNRKISFFNELGVKSRTGYFGKRSSVNIVYTEHESTIFQYKGVVSQRLSKSLHQLEITLEQEILENMENAFRKETSVGGNSTVVYYGQNKTLNRTTSKASIGYTASLDMNTNNPGWIIQAGASYSGKNQTSVVYPAFRNQLINAFAADLFVKRNIIRNNNMYGFYLGNGYGFGNGTDKEDGQYGSSDAQSSAVSLDHYLNREYEYLTAQRIYTCPGFRYTRLLKDQHIKLYGDVNYNLTKAFSTNYIGDTFGNLTLKVGCTF